jgi:hypothetical protein
MRSSKRKMMDGEEAFQSDTPPRIENVCLYERTLFLPRTELCSNSSKTKRLCFRIHSDLQTREEARRLWHRVRGHACHRLPQDENEPELGVKWMCALHLEAHDDCLSTQTAPPYATEGIQQPQKKQEHEEYVTFALREFYCIITLLLCFHMSARLPWRSASLYRI